MCARVVTVIGDGRVYFGRGGRGPLGGGPGQGGKLEFPMEGILVWQCGSVMVVVRLVWWKVECRRLRIAAA